MSFRPSLYECPECGEFPRSCTCLRKSVRQRIADAIHFPEDADSSSVPFLTVEPVPALEPPRSAA
jgi:hypothetical protein